MGALTHAVTAALPMLTACIKLLDEASRWVVTEALSMNEYQVKLPEGRSGELCCLAVSENLMAAGSVSHVHMIDPRAHNSTAALTSLDAQEVSCPPGDREVIVTRECFNQSCGGGFCQHVGLFVAEHMAASVATPHLTWLHQVLFSSRTPGAMPHSTGTHK